MNAHPPQPGGEPQDQPPVASRDLSWRRSRYGFALFWFLSLLAGWQLLRLVLFFGFKTGGAPWGDAFQAFASGLHRDIFVGLLFTLPLLTWMLLVPEKRWVSRTHRVLFWSGAFIFWLVEIFLLFVEFFFFEEFKSRFNTVAVDYLLYPHEVFVNIWQSYNVVLVLSVCLVLSVGWLWVATRYFEGMWRRPFPARRRLGYILGTAAAAAALVPTLNFKSAHVGADRTLNEMANNGAISFAAAGWTRHLDYTNFYQTIGLDEAYARTRRRLTEPGAEFVEPGLSVRRKIAGDPARPRLNLVLIIEESLGSEFWGCLGRKKTLTPEMDRIAQEEGMLFTGLYATGNRTVRGLEGVLSSFPPLPGDSIVKRDRSENVETLARVLKRDGYDTVFLYGGRGVFDGMRSYAVRNGYDSFIEQKHFSNPTFTTIWGVCDEDLFARGIEECRERAQTGRPFFATMLTVSNHKPYTYPEGRIPEDPRKQHRTNAVKYSDYALGQFFRAAKKESFWTNTIFVVVADHGARVYGKQTLPIHSYEIPMVIAGPAVVKNPARISQRGCSMDVGPTLLSLIGRPYESLFLGRNLLQLKPEDGRVFLNHNRDIGMLAQDRMVVLGLMKSEEFYQGDPKQTTMSLMETEPGPQDREIQKDAVAMFQVADDLYVNRRYRLESSP